MEKTLGGSIFAYNTIQYDYCLKEAVECLKELCDEVVVLDAGSTDGTHELVKSFQDKKTQVVLCGPEEWENKHGKEKLSYFTNLASAFLTTDYYFNLQADEIIHEKSFPIIRKAVESGEESFFVRRYNLWGTPDTYLNVPHDRQPCGERIIRLGILQCKSVDDAEGLRPYSKDPSTLYCDEIKVYHYGFVRKKEVMKDKIIHMQRGVFEMDHDKKLDHMDVFDWTAWFKPEDLSPIRDSHPKFITNWIKNRP